MIVRVQGRDRIMRIEVETGATIADLVAEINNRTGSVCTSLAREGKEVSQGSIAENGIEHGDMLTAEYEVQAQAPPPETSETPETPDTPETRATAKSSPALHTGCTHGPTGMCANCAPEDSWLSQSFENRRFISQGAHEEFMVSQGRELYLQTHLPPLCKTHPSDGRCNRCMPKEIALTRQPFRAVDHIELHDRNLLEQLVSHYREKRTQMAVLLVGRYSEYTEVAKGVKAEVFATVHIEQKNLSDGFILNQSDRALCGKDESLNKLLSLLQMEIVGIAYTRLRETEIPFITGLEVDFITKLQNLFPDMDKGTNKGSKFVTLVISGSRTQSEIFEFMGTMLAMELVTDKLLKASESPTAMTIFPATALWTGSEGTKREHSIPVEYLVVRPTHGLTTNRTFFYSVPGERAPFRRGQDTSALKKHFQKRMKDSTVNGLSLQAISDFQVLLALSDMGLLTDALVECVSSGDDLRFTDMIFNNETDSLLEITKECKEVSTWSCHTCTLLNASSHTICEACGIPKT
ncbi:nuclear protein localization protein 4 -like protein [Nematocida displodere]|uniref:Nuclear protein localization protein 4 n=1 Tax=Nematocida displodere TaxID=1805483 RepID=A0A177EJK4_9MICR|nr:nuclear protein localization protein 4 -like protein [Nematocida displodere]